MSTSVAATEWVEALRAADTVFETAEPRAAYDAYRALTLPESAVEERVRVAARLLELGGALREVDAVAPLALAYLALRPEEADVALQVAHWLRDNGEAPETGLDRAQRFLVAAREQIPALAGRHELAVALGELAEAQGRDADALQWFERAMGAGFATPEFLRHIAKVFLRMGNADAAVETLRSARLLEERALAAGAGGEVGAQRPRVPADWPPDADDYDKRDDVVLRGEADLYGYTDWLARHLRLPIVPLSLRGFQHGWIWWDPKDAPLDKGWGLDPNFHDFWGSLVQDETIAEAVAARGTFAEVCGLPFLSFYAHSGLKGSFTAGRAGRTLFIPYHSTPWQSFADAVLQGVQASVAHASECSVMLAWNDRHLAPTIAPKVRQVVIGAGSMERRSFYRLVRAFESHEYMITNAMGSHVCYALACGMKVGILRGSFRNMQSVAPPGAKPVRPDQRAVGELEYLGARYPGLVFDGGTPTYDRMPEIPVAPPEDIARLLGWEMTLPSEMAARSRGLRRG